MKEGNESKISLCSPRVVWTAPYLFRVRVDLVGVECLYMIKAMVLVFVLLEFDVTLGGGCKWEVQVDCKS